MEKLWNFGKEKSLSVKSLVLFYGNLEEKRVERNADDKGLDHEVLEGSLRFISTLLGLLHICCFEQ